MIVPEIVVELIGLTAIAAGGFGFKFLHNATKKNAADIATTKEAIFARMDERNKDILQAVKSMETKLTPMTHCDAKQELWQERFSALMEKNSSEHIHLGGSLDTSLIGVDRQLEVLFKEMEKISNCIDKIQKMKEC